MRGKLLLQLLIAAALLGIFLFIPGSRDYLSSVIHLLTEGNSYGKGIVFIGFFILMAAVKIAIPKLPKNFGKIEQKRLRRALMIAILCGFAFNLLANMLILQKFGAPLNGYAAHVTDCSGITCWEATYTLHSHSLKPAIYFIEKEFGIGFGPSVDNGKPMYDISPYPDAVSVLTLAILAIIFVLSILLALREREYWKFLLLEFAAIASIISVLDGGFMTVAGINAIVLLVLYDFSHSKSLSWKHFLALFGLMLIIGEIIPRITQTNIIYLGWFAPGLLAISIFLFFEKPRDLPKKFSHAAMLFILIFSLYHLNSLFNFVHYGEHVEPPGKAIIYGFPESSDTDAALKEFSNPPLSSYNRIGWFAVIRPESGIMVKQLVGNLKQSVKPEGYFLGELDLQPPKEVEISLRFLENPQKPVKISTYSFKPTGDAICSGNCVVDGTTTLYSTHLALEIGSYLHSKGYDAVVVTPVMWKYD
ncbi:MAG: hypothetical protein ABIG96_06100 [Candidatus Micrarchaeota archaeon]